jgi:hypothetical protein
LDKHGAKPKDLSVEDLSSRIMSERNTKGRPQMATTAIKAKTSAELLAEKMGQLVEKASKTMTDEQFREAEKKSAAITSRVRDRASRRGKA